MAYRRVASICLLLWLAWVLSTWAEWRHTDPDRVEAVEDVTDLRLVWVAKPLVTQCRPVSDRNTGGSRTGRDEGTPFGGRLAGSQAPVFRVWDWSTRTTPWIQC